MLFRWFLDMDMVESSFDPMVLTKNRARLVEHDVGKQLLGRIVRQDRAEGLMSSEHFAVDGTLIEAWASLKTFRRKDKDPSDRHRRTTGAIRRWIFAVSSGGTTRTSRRPPESRVARKSNGTTAKLTYSQHALMENRNGLLVDLRIAEANGTPERDTALKMLEWELPGTKRITFGGDKGYDTKPERDLLPSRGLARAVHPRESPLPDLFDDLEATAQVLCARLHCPVASLNSEWSQATLKAVDFVQRNAEQDLGSPGTCSGSVLAQAKLWRYLMRLHLLVAGMLLTLAAPLSRSAHAGGLAGEVSEYGKQHQLPIARLKTAGPKPGDGPVHRLFVPILPGTWGDFQERFTTKNGGVLLNFTSLDYKGAVMARRRGEGLTFIGGPEFEQMLGNKYMQFAPGSATVAFKLSDEKLAHMNRWIEASGPELRAKAGGHSFKWLNNVEVAPNRLLMHELGVRRSMDGPQMRAKFLYSAGEDVEVVGVHVNSAEEFRERIKSGQIPGPRPVGDPDQAGPTIHFFTK
jgi:hypothetical protein